MQHLQASGNNVNDSGCMPDYLLFATITCIHIQVIVNSNFDRRIHLTQNTWMPFRKLFIQRSRVPVTMTISLTKANLTIWLKWHVCYDINSATRDHRSLKDVMVPMSALCPWEMIMRPHYYSETSERSETLNILYPLMVWYYKIHDLT